MFNRFKLGRTLDEAYAYGCNLLFEELALAVCTHEGIDLRFNHLDTTSFSLTGDYIPARPLTGHNDNLFNRLHMNNGVRSTWPALTSGTRGGGKPRDKSSASGSHTLDD